MIKKTALLCPPSKKEVHIALYMSVGMLVSDTLCKGPFVPHTSNLVHNPWLLNDPCFTKHLLFISALPSSVVLMPSSQRRHHVSWCLSRIVSTECPRYFLILVCYNSLFLENTHADCWIHIIWGHLTRRGRTSDLFPISPEKRYPFLIITMLPTKTVKH